MPHRLVVHVSKKRFDVYVGRPSAWGNYVSHISSEKDRDAVIAEYRAWLLSKPKMVERVKRELRGKILGCWCAPKCCHGDVLAEIANED